jgi:signal transduction histidine kinase
MDKFEFFSKFNDAVIVINDKRDVLYQNHAFKRTFADFVDLRKFSHQLNFDICALDGDNVEVYSPIYQALNSAQNFFACVTYQNINKDVFYFEITAIKRNKYVVIIFKDVSAQVRITSIAQEYKQLSSNYKRLHIENQNFVKIKQKAQSQAIKMVMINKMSNIIRESIDISKITKAALKELSAMFGAFKGYYASSLDKSFSIDEVCGKEYKSEIGSIIKFDESTYKSIVNKEIVVSNCLKEHLNAKQNFKESATRIIVPIYHLNQLLGVIVLLSSQKRELNDEIGILESVSAQLGNAIIQASLFSQVNKQKDELQLALKELKDTQVQLINSEKMASLGQLIAGVAHEINTPLASINSNNSIMSKVIKKIEDSQTAELLKEINDIDKEAVLRINNIVKSLKKFVRLDEAELQEADINKELDLTLVLIRHETKNKIKIIKNYGDLPLIKCYPNMLNQVFMNILVNACQSIKGEGQIVITTLFEDNKLIVKIKDSGVGIAPELVDKIFTAGYTTKGVGVGTGLGLAISQKIIQKHSGEITVNSEQSKGTEFIITIPGE